MKDGLENSFKEALNHFELPYDAKAWESLNKKLSAKKWYQSTQMKWSAALVIAIGVAAYFVLPSSATRTIKQPNDKIAKKETNSTSVSPQQRETSASTTLPKTDKRTNSNEVNPLMDIRFTPPVVVTDVDELIPHSIPPIFNQMEVLGLNEQVIENQEPTPTFNGRVVQMDFKNRCQGESLHLEADYYHERWINYAGKQYHFGYNQSISLKLTEPGKVVLTANSGPYGQFEEFGSFEVHPTPSISISSDRTLNFEDGLPKVSCQVEAGDAQITWHSNYALTNNNGKLTEVLAFEKGFAIVEAQAISSNGCKSQEKEMIQVPSDYNLLAVNAFNPQSLDSRNSTFMPYALTIRQTPFKMVVLDPDNGGIVFESSDADNAWDGIDRRDGKMVPNNKAFIWKVSLLNPVAGEKAEYRGTIVRL